MSDKQEDSLLQGTQAGWEEFEEESSGLPEDDSAESSQEMILAACYVNFEQYGEVICGGTNEGETAGSPVGNSVPCGSDGEQGPDDTDDETASVPGNAWDDSEEESSGLPEDDSAETSKERILARHYANYEEYQDVIFGDLNEGHLARPFTNVAPARMEYFPPDEIGIRLSIDDGEPAAGPLGDLVVGAQVCVTDPRLGGKTFHMGTVIETENWMGNVRVEWDSRPAEPTYVNRQWVSSVEEVGRSPRSTRNSPNRTARGV
jgi:hypothetical protein